ncbi:uncharacterized protein [Bos taurus]|uniref:uncharacterized protein n=1 Tax=Bos taurus TaxID=9913 RepID=UPI000572DD64|nr:uncharacterized protein LOC101905308 [Bos taurus]
MKVGAGATRSGGRGRSDEGRESLRGWKREALPVLSLRICRPGRELQLIRDRRRQRQDSDFKKAPRCPLCLLRRSQSTARARGVRRGRSRYSPPGPPAAQPSRPRPWKRRPEQSPRYEPLPQIHFQRPRRSLRPPEGQLSSTRPAVTPPRRPLVFLPQEESTERPTQSRISPQPRPRDWGPGRPFSSAYRCGGGGGGIADLPRRRWEMSADPLCRPPVKVTATSRNLFGKAPKCLFCRKPAMVRWGLVLRELSRGLDVLVLESSPAQAHFSRASQVTFPLSEFPAPVHTSN